MKKVWIKCPKCGHKLFLWTANERFDYADINIKCSSCKRIVDVCLRKGGSTAMEQNKKEA